MRLLTLLLTALTATSGEDTHTTVRVRGTYIGEGVSLLLFRSSWQWQSGRGG